MTTVAPPPRPPATRPAPPPIKTPTVMLRGWLGRPESATPRAAADGQLAMVVLNLLAALLLGFIAQVTIVGTLKHNRDQQIAYDDLRLTLAEGTAPVGPVDGKPLPKGTPLARVSIPAIGVKEIVLSGTSAGVLRSGVGHRRDTVLPGQAGTSVLMGHRMAYGGPLSKLGDLNTGDTIDVVTGQGATQYKVSGIRRAGSANPPAVAAGSSRLTLMTSSGPRFSPNDTVRVDADVVGPVFTAAAPAFTPTSLPTDERPMAKEAAALQSAVGWGMLLVAGAVGCVWLRARWGRWQAWLVAVPTLAYLGISVADHTARLLPNLL